MMFSSAFIKQLRNNNKMYKRIKTKSTIIFKNNRKFTIQITK